MSPTFERTLEIALKCASKHRLVTRLDANSGEIEFFPAQTVPPSKSTTNRTPICPPGQFEQFLKRLGGEEKAEAVGEASKFFSTERLCQFWPSPGISSRPLGRILIAQIKNGQLRFIRRAKEKRIRGFTINFVELRKFILSTQEL